MKQIQLTITAQSPLAIGRQKPGGSVSEVENCIPGSVIRGAIAAEILKLAEPENDDLSEPQTGGEFQVLFLGDQPAIFRNAYPAIARVEDENQLTSGEVKVLPATAVSSKVNSGFQPKGDGVFDTLIDEFWATQYNYPYDPSNPQGKEDRIEPYGGFYSQINGSYYGHSVSSRFLTRVGINRRRATAEEQILYSIAVLNERIPKNPKASVLEWEKFSYRSSIVVCDSDLANKLKAFIERNCDTFRIGGAISRGLGKVKITAEDGTLSQGVMSRIEQFNKALRERGQFWSIFGELKESSPNRFYFTLDLQSDAILTENWRRTTVISEAMLCQFAGINDKSLKLHATYSSYDYRSGWNAAWGLMKDVELVTNKGAVYLFSIDEFHKEDWCEALTMLENEGIGDRTCEGFGDVEICNPFHLVFREGAA